MLHTAVLLMCVFLSSQRVPEWLSSPAAQRALWGVSERWAETRQSREQGVRVEAHAAQSP